MHRDQSEPIPMGSLKKEPRSLHRLQGQTGQALIEFMVVLPVLAILLFGIIEMGAAWRTYQVATHAAREGARLTVLPGADENDVRSKISDRLVQGGLMPGTATVDFTCSGACFGSTRTAGSDAQVRVAYPFSFVLLGPIANWVSGGGGAFGNITMETTTVMRIE